MPISLNDDNTRRLLDELDTDGPVSQRSMARNMGIALGLTNLLLRRFVAKGWVRVSGIRPHRVKYLLTPAGIAEKARLSQAAFHNSIDRYRAARTRVLGAFTRLSAAWPAGAPSKPILFFGTGEVAEIGFICLQETDLRLTGVIDDQGRTQFMNVPVLTVAEALHQVGGTRVVVVMSLAPSDAVTHALAPLLEAGYQVVRI